MQKCFPAANTRGRRAILLTRSRLTCTSPNSISTPPPPVPQLEVYREEITLGENAVAALRRQQAAYEERATVVATEWNASVSYTHLTLPTN